MTLCAPGPLFVHNYGKGFPIEWARRVFPREKPTDHFDNEREPATNEQIIDWLTK